MMKVYQRQNY